MFTSKQVYYNPMGCILTPNIEEKKTQRYLLVRASEQSSCSVSILAITLLALIDEI